MTVTISEQEILSKPNYYELGEYLHTKYWEMKRNLEHGRNDDENFIIHSNENNVVTKIQKPWTCSICGKDTSEVEYDYLVGYDHLACVLQGDPKMDEKDICVICGQETPYLRSTPIDQRIGYVEGGGQGCYQSHICDKN